MKYVESGDGRIPLISLIAILSISLTVNLPGLAISPIMGKLHQVFTGVTELEIQLLTVLPNIVTIPFILCAGKICTQKNQMTVLGVGLGLYTLTGVLYFFATNIVELIVLSCLLGVGCGLVIPLAASLISQYFFGKSRTRQLGMKSSLSNFTVIFATLFVGWIAAINWHLSFIVYLVPIIPLCLIPFMTGKFINRHRSINPNTPLSTASPKPDTKKTLQFSSRSIIILLGCLMALYLIMTYATEVISYYLPFAMEHYHLTTADVGVATAMFFAAATVSGFLLTRIIGIFGTRTMQVALFICAVGLLFVGFVHSYWAYVTGVFAMGLGYGVIQPVIYDKTSELAPSPAKNTAYFSYLLTCNYIGISCVPFVISGMRKIFEVTADDVSFSFVFNGIVVVAVLLLAIWKHNSFVFKTVREKPE